MLDMAEWSTKLVAGRRVVRDDAEESIVRQDGSERRRGGDSAQSARAEGHVAGK